jgi:hypothetical protein
MTSNDSKEITISMARAQMLGLAFLGLAFALLVPYWALYGSDALKEVRQFFQLLILVPAAAAGIVVHELIHGIAWTLASGNGWDKIKFGFQLKTLTPYAHSTVPMKQRAYQIGAAMPLIVLGILPYLFALVAKNPMVLGFGVFFTYAAAGDIMILWITRHVDKNQLVQDHPTDAGIVLVDA